MSRTTLFKKSVHQRVESHAAMTPDAITIAGDRVVTYQELYQRSNRLAAQLRSAGVGPDTVVGLWLGTGI